MEPSPAVGRERGTVVTSGLSQRIVDFLAAQNWTI
jgi:hypothetical protein